MADVGIFTKNADIQARCGTNANATSKATAATDVYVLNIESVINAMTRYNWSDAYTTGLNADVQGILTDLGASMCAIIVIQSDMNSYPSRTEAENLVNINRDVVLRNMSILRDKEVQRFIQNA